MKLVLCLVVVLGMFAMVHTKVNRKHSLITHNDISTGSSLGRSRKNKQGKGTQSSLNMIEKAGGAYDSLVLATEWSGSVCRLQKCNNGRPANRNFFNLHGLWPNDAADFHNSPFNCDDTRVSLVSLPKETQNVLNFYWNPLYNGAESFLNHEWTKHGSCWKPQPRDINAIPSEIRKLVSDAMSTPASNKIQRQVNYFGVSIALAQKNNVFNALASQGVLPNNTRKYTKDNIEKALFSYFKINAFQVQCKKSSTGDSLLMEVRLCMDLNYQVISCRRHSFECANQVMYPEYM